ncbi:Ubiquinol-cytochrome c reductase iron-sulfur subunit [Georgfuchsia toluolica]|uniref:Ubiquinol-cytochrome c reductase iron-sulfur subunit n=1 Tax=Georgfuchsia toluolica TaxID=424218 RepID=A0A916N2H5_9PROT|nr:ubiquinol-cytochrome c reductase iron-sulfur subunit [Georgfuchsia toluolica]CAG4883899.1 Ubiquinol-cytochrome c reductase iron-sulfur subunit [Georgfuchsia toluolica]
MTNKETIDDSRRSLMKVVATAGGVAGIGALAVSVTPFIESMQPSERAKAAGAPVEVDISRLKPGQIVTVEWRGRPVWILHRTPEMLESLKATAARVVDPMSENSVQPKYCQNETRSIKPSIMVALNVCTHLGCSPTPKFVKGIESGIDADWEGGFYCPCHSSTYDLAGRVFKDKLAPANLEVPPYRFVGDGKLIIGEENNTKKA